MAAAKTRKQPRHDSDNNKTRPRLKRFETGQNMVPHNKTEAPPHPRLKVARTKNLERAVRSKADVVGLEISADDHVPRGRFVVHVMER